MANGSSDLAQHLTLGFGTDQERGVVSNPSEDETSSSDESRMPRRQASRQSRKGSSWCCGPQCLFGIRRALKVVGFVTLLVAFVCGLFGVPSSMIDNNTVKANTMSVLFLVGLVLVVLEDHVGVNKAAVMLLTAGAMWTFLAASYHPHTSKEGHEELDHEMDNGIKEVGQLLLFLLPAMGIVESIDHFEGFLVVTHYIMKWTGGKEGFLMAMVCLLVFFLSAIIDNLTATIVALKLVKHLVPLNRGYRHMLGGLVVIAANAGGAWSPVGDVTTTMLWLAKKISVTSTIKWLLVPSFVAGVFPMGGIYLSAHRLMRESRLADETALEVAEEEPVDFHTSHVLVLVLGVSSILMVPVLKMVTGLPPYLGMLMALGVLWLVTDTVAFHKLARLPDDRDRDFDDEGGSDIGEPRTPRTIRQDRPGSVVEALHSMDLTGLLFFAGVLLAVGALDTSGVLKNYAKMLIDLCAGSPALICTLLGVSSAIVDNVPLVQAAIDMFGDLPMDDPLWQLTALAAGTGGSILSVGSIAGVTLMTMEGVGYIWYVQKISVWAALGFFGGIATYQVECWLFR